MKSYKALSIPDDAPMLVKVGDILNARQVASLLEINAQELVQRSEAASRMGSDGYWFEILEPSTPAKGAK